MTTVDVSKPVRRLQICPDHRNPHPQDQYRGRSAMRHFGRPLSSGLALLSLTVKSASSYSRPSQWERIAYPADFGARILPVNYLFVDECIIFRTVPDGEIYRHALHSNCAFEIDETNEFFESGWSVVVLGRLELATEEDFARMQYGGMPAPWAVGDRRMFVRLGCEHLSGRRVIGHAR
jgi:hypothetical protein